jgi:hypothetical protein
LENHDAHVMVISPRVVESELAHTISDTGARAAMQDFRKIALPPVAIAYAMEQSADAGVKEIIVAHLGRAIIRIISAARLNSASRIRAKPNGRWHLAETHTTL